MNQPGHINHGGNNHMNTYLNGLTYSSFYWKAKYYELLQQYHKLLYQCKINHENDSDDDDDNANTNTNTNDYDWYGSKTTKTEKRKNAVSPPLLPPHPMPIPIQPIPKDFHYFPHLDPMNKNFAIPHFHGFPPQSMNKNFVMPTHEIPPSTQPTSQTTFQVPPPPQPIIRDCSGMIKGTHHFPFHRYIGFEPPYTHFGEDLIQQ